MTILEIQPFISKAFGFLRLISALGPFYVASSTMGQGRKAVVERHYGVFSGRLKSQAFISRQRWEPLCIGCMYTKTRM